jgi:hypothetical protein
MIVDDIICVIVVIITTIIINLPLGLVPSYGVMRACGNMELKLYVLLRVGVVA